MIIEKKYLEEYAYLGDRIYMNVSSIGIQPERTRAFSRIFLDEYSQTLGNPSFGGGSHNYKSCVQAVASLIGCAAEDVFLTKNTTEGNNLIPYGYPLEPGDEVIVGNGDFVSVWLPWAGLQKRGIKVVVVQNENGVTAAEDYLEKVTPKTKAIAISWVQSSSGYTADLALLGEFCRSRGIILCVDAIQGMGRLPMDVEKLKIDVLASGSFKGLLGVMGAGFCYCRPEIMEKIDPHLCSGNLESYDFPWSGFTEAPVPVLAGRAARMESGTTNHYGYAMMRTSIQLLTEIGVDRIAEQIRSTELLLRKELREAFPGIRFLGKEEDPSTFSGTCSVVLNSLYDPKKEREHLGKDAGQRENALKNYLEDRGIYVTVRNGFLRISLHYFNTKEQAKTLVCALKAFQEEERCC